MISSMQNYWNMMSWKAAALKAEISPAAEPSRTGPDRTGPEASSTGILERRMTPMHTMKTVFMCEDASPREKDDPSGKK